MEHIQDLEQQLAQAKAAAQPIIIEKVKDTADEVVYENKTSGTVRVDRRGGEPVKFYEQPPAPAPEVSLVEKPFDSAIGKIVLVDDSKRVIDLTNGTKRTDLR